MAEKTKKWKGKDWYDILSPDLFKNKKIGESPASAPKYILKRVITVPVKMLIEGRKYAKSMGNLAFKINKVEDKTAYTIFHKYFVSRDFMYMVVRKRVQKVDFVQNYKTKDNWKLQMNMLVILNRNVCKEVRTRVRHLINSELEKILPSTKLDNLVMAVINSEIQQKLRKLINKIYPARVCEVTKIEVLSRPKTE